MLMLFLFGVEIKNQVSGKSMSSSLQLVSIE